MVKMRAGFVTNSSSSSFVIIGKRVRLEDIDLSKGKYVALGEYLCEGQDVFYVTEDMLDVLGTLDFDFDYCLVSEYMREPEGKPISLNGDFLVWAGSKDMHSSGCASDLLENYRGY